MCMTYTLWPCLISIHLKSKMDANSRLCRLCYTPVKPVKVTLTKHPQQL